MLRFLMTHMLMGMAAGWVVLGAFFALDIAQLRTLIVSSPDGGLAAVLLAFFFALTFGSVGMGYGVMTNGASDDEPRGGRPQRATRRGARFVPIPATATPKKPIAR